MSEGNSKSFDKTFRDVLSLNSTISLIKSEQPTANGGDSNKIAAEDKISGLVPIFKLDDLAELDDNSFGKIVLSDDIVIFNGLVYVKTVEIGFQSRVSELINQYTNQMRQEIGDKRALIEAYERIPIVDLVSLTSKNIVLTVENKALVAIRHLDTVKVVFRDRTWDFPPLTIKVPIFDGVPSNDVYVCSMDEDRYMHPFVFYHDKGKNTFDGQKLCMGDFNPNGKSVRFNDNKRWDELNLAQKLLILIPQAVQILTTGYNPNVSPANGHLTDGKYNRYLTKKGGKN